jgi:hypothetical protein
VLWRVWQPCNNTPQTHTSVKLSPNRFFSFTYKNTGKAAVMKAIKYNDGSAIAGIQGTQHRDAGKISVANGRANSPQTHSAQLLRHTPRTGRLRLQNNIVHGLLFDDFIEFRGRQRVDAAKQQATVGYVTAFLSLISTMPTGAESFTHSELLSQTRNATYDFPLGFGMTAGHEMKTAKSDGDGVWCSATGFTLDWQSSSHTVPHTLRPQD